MMMLTGARPDTKECRERDRSEYSFDDQASPAVSGSTVALMQAVSWIRDQKRFPSCYGQAFAARIDAVTNQPPWASGVGIWREARRRQGQVERIDLGIRGDHAITGLVHRGWDDYEEGEDESVSEASKQDDLYSELVADDRRLGLKRFQRFRIWRTGADRIEQLRSALATPGMVVTAAAYLRPTFKRAKAKDGKPVPTLDRSHFGGGNDSHAMGVFAAERVKGRYRIGLQNSWGRKHGGIVLPDGTFQPGCVWVDEAAIGDDDLFHDIHCLGVQR